MGGTAGAAAGGAAKGAAAGSIVPGIGTAIGAGVGALGSIVGQGKANKAAKEKEARQRADIATAQGRLDEWLGQQQAFQQGIPVDQLLAMAGGPATSETSTSINQLESPEAQAQDVGLTNMLRQQFENQLQASALPPGYLENIARGGAEQIRELQSGLSNRAAQVGGQSSQQSALDAMLAGAPIISGVKSQIAGAPLQAEQIMNQRRAAAQGFLDPRLARRTKGRTSSSTTSYNPQSSIASILGIYGTQAPTKPDIILPT